MKKLRLILVWAVLAYPITWIFQKVVGIPIFDSYHEILYSGYVILYACWDWLLILFLTYIFNRNIVQIKYDTLEKIRQSRFHAEVDRWFDTPYIPPLMMYYLLNPPQSVSTDIYKSVSNRFYQLVVFAFRDRVFINGQSSSYYPAARKSHWRIIGLKEFLKTSLVSILIVGWFASVTINDPESWLFGNERFSIPVVIFLGLYVAMKIQAYLEMSYNKLDVVIEDHFGEKEPKVSWPEVFPDQPKGKVITAAWQAETEKRQRYTNLIKEQQLYNNPNYRNHALAPYPYPSDSIPEWAENIEIPAPLEKTPSMNGKSKKNNKVTKGNVVNFRRRES
ncbi:hypothetical protein [Bacillus sp. UMB0728]|uniref:hypothetical protein n=1 Tax=Bacillus sp. UMB0728 TaxID=2066052 RepID=UPI000C7714F3|nr:hypothetical protein [Bacillus sp. UMB0728]PLR70484.1 hypothetical protein CYJ37_23410 [Bacillus sp. UMB0728]